MHAWNGRFFGLGCAKFGRMLNLHPITASKSRLDETFVSISTSLNTIDRLHRCRIDGASFAVRIKEIKCIYGLARRYPSRGGEHFRGIVGILNVGGKGRS